VSWTFATSLAERATRLRAAAQFADIIDQINGSMRILCAHQQQAHDHTFFYRAVFCVCVDRDLFDLFFNSEEGLRGAFYRSPFAGLAATAQFIGALLPRLQAHGQIDPHPRIDTPTSLTTLSAKAWLAEKTLQLCTECEGEWEPPKERTREIINGRWDESIAAYARYGEAAPYLTKIRILGAFVNPAGDEFVPSRKVRRAYEIHEVGWS
jgi:hypothetical protein